MPCLAPPPPSPSPSLIVPLKTKFSSQAQPMVQPGVMTSRPGSSPRAPKDCKLSANRVVLVSVDLRRQKGDAAIRLS